jgi:hypothetical protein
MSALHYRLPPDILHYEVKYMFGLSVQDMMMSALPGMGIMARYGLVWGLVAALVTLAGLKRFEVFGDRSVLVYLALWAWHRYKPKEVYMPRVLPTGGELPQMEVTTWDGDPLYTVGEGS